MTERLPCPTECGRTVEPGRLLCRSCWSKVPAVLQRDVNVSWRNYCHADIDDPAALDAARTAYIEARSAAILAVTS